MMSSEKVTPPYALNTAVLFLVFNRLDTTKQVFDEIRQAKPPRLYIAADGARADKDGEAQKVQIVRDYIMQNIDWECDVKTLFREKNLGCKYAVSGAITWFFENEEQGIILEDDCLPNQSFFWFCEEMLENYKSDDRIGQISGFNYGYKMPIEDYDYFFSKYGFIWGWASWRRAWEKYSLDMALFPETKEINLYDNYFKENKDLQLSNFNNVYDGSLDTWDYQWSYSRFINSLYTIVPKYNLIENIGFGDDATHTFGTNPYNMLERQAFDMRSIRHPSYFIQFKTFYDIHERKDGFLKRKIKGLLNAIK